MPDWFKLSTNLLAWVVFPHLSTPSKRINAPRDKDFAAIFASSSSEYLFRAAAFRSRPSLFSPPRTLHQSSSCFETLKKTTHHHHHHHRRTPSDESKTQKRKPSSSSSSSSLLLLVPRCASRSPFRALPFLFSLEQRSLVKSKGHSTISFSLLFSLFFEFLRP